ncbi:Ubiquitin family protein, partial [Trichostrongylus colubriformis]
YELKRTISIATDVAPEHQLLLYKDKELSDNTATLAQYGIVSACTLTMNVKMHTGLLVDQVALSNVMLLPLLLPRNNVGHLRRTIRTMTNVQE